MKRKKVIFIPQLIQHFNSIEYLKKELLKLGNSVDILNTGEFFGYNFEGDLRLDFQSIYGLNYANTSGLRRNLITILIIIKNKKFINKLLRNYDEVIIFSEPALFRYIINNAKKLGLRTHLIMEGMRSNNLISFNYIINFSSNLLRKQLILRVKYLIAKIFRGSSIDHLLPGLNGSTRVDYIYPIGEYSKNVISKIVTNSTKILDYGIPRYSHIKPFKKNNIIKKKKLYYYTSAFSWHGKHSLSTAQSKDLLLLIDFVKNNNDFFLVIKNHPKGIISNKIKELRLNNLEIDYEYNLEKDFNNGYMFFANLSTIIAEGLLYGMKIYSVLINFDKIEFINSFVHHLPHKVIDSEFELLKILNNENDFSTVENERNKVIYNNPNSIIQICKQVDR